MENNTLFDVLIGINEKGSTSLMNAQLERVATKLMDLKVKMSLDGESTKDITSKISKVAKEIAQMKTVDLSQDGLMKKFSAEINTVLNDYKMMDATVTKVATTSTGAFNGMTIAVKDLENNLQTIRFNKDLVETSSSFTNGFQKNLLSMQKEISNTQKALEKVKTAIAAGQGTPELTAKEVALTNELTLSYGKLAVVVRNTESIGEERKAQIIASLALSKQLSQANLTEAETTGKNIKAKKEMNLVLSAYKDQAKALTNIQLTKGADSEEAKAAQQTLDTLRLQATGYDAVLAKMDEVSLKQQKTFSTKYIEQQNKELTALIPKLEKLSSSITNKQSNLLGAQETGDNLKVINLTQELEKLQKEFDDTTAKGLKLSESLNRVGAGDKIKKIATDFKNTSQAIAEASDVTGILERKFGKFLEAASGGQDVEELAKAFKEGTIAQKELGEAIFGTDAILKRTNPNTDKHKQITKGLQASVKDTEGVYRLWNIVLDENANKLRITGGQVDSMAHKVSGFGNQIMDAAKKIATWGISTKIVYGTWRAFLAGVEVVKELDKELTQIAIVSGQTRDSVKYLGEEYAATAVKMAQSVQEVAKLNTELVRQGLSIEEAAKRADTIMKLSAAGNITMEQSLQVITTGVNALGEAHTKVADVILKAANLSASDVEGLGEAFSKTASGAKAAGMSIEETTSLLATMKDITQEGDSQLGTSLKSMLARFNKINEETGEMNEDLNQVQTSIESVGVAFLDGEGQIRNVYDILQDLSGTWGTLDKNTKAYIATQAAGVRQQNRFFAVMDNFNQVQAMNNDLTRAAGTLQGAYGTYLESTEAASVRLKATLDQLWIKFIDSNVIKFIAEVGAGLLGLLDSIGLIGTAITALLLKMTFSKFLVELPKVTAELAATAAAAKTTSGLFGSMGVSAKIFGQTAVTSLGAVATSIGTTLIAFWPLLAAIALVGGIVWYTKNQQKQHDEQMKDLAEKRKGMEDLQNSYYSNQASLETLGTKYLEYQNKIATSGSVMSLSKAELAEYYDVQSQLKEILPDLTTTEDIYGQTILTNVTSVEQLNYQYDQLLAKRKADIAANLPKHLEQINEQYKEQKKYLEEFEVIEARQLARKGMLDANIEAGGSNKTRERLLAGIAEDEALLKEKRAAYAIELAQYGRDLLAVTLTQYTDMDAKLQQLLMNSNMTGLFAGLDEEKIKAKIAEITTILSTTKIRLGGESLDYSGLMAKLEEMKGQIGRTISPEQYVQEFNKIGPQIEAALVNIGGEGVGDELLTAWRENMQAFAYSAEEAAFVAAENLKSVNDKFVSDFKELEGELDELASFYETVTDAKMTDAEVDAAILSTHPQWMQFLGDRVGLENALAQAYSDTANTQAEAYLVMLENTGQFTLAAYGMNADYFASLGIAYTDDLANSKSRAQAKMAVEHSLIQSMGGMWTKFFEATGEGIKVQIDAIVAYAQQNKLSGEAYKYLVDSATKTAAKMNISADKFKLDLGNITIDTKTIMQTAGGIGKHTANIKKDLGGAAKSAGDAADAMKEAEDAAKAWNDEMKAIQDTTKEVFDFALEYIKWIEEQKRDEIEKTYEDEEKLIEDAFESKNDAIEKEKEGQLDILQIKEDAIKAEQEALDFLQARSDLQEKIVDLEYSLAIASLDSSVAGATRRRTIEQQLADERKNLDNLEQERERTLQEEAFARQRAFIEDEAAYQQALNETTRTKKLADNQAIHDEAIRLLDIQYSDENSYLLAKQATQSGMIANLAGDMIPLVEAFKQLAIENGNFWTFFGQEDVKNFETSVTTALEAIKRLGFETIQMWKEVAVAAGAASSATSSAASAGSGGSGGSGGGSPSTPAPAAPAAPNPQTELNKTFQTWLKESLTKIGYTTLSKSLAVDGSIGPATRNAALTLANSARTNQTSDYILKAISAGSKITSAFIGTLRGQGIGAATTATASKTITSSGGGTGTAYRTVSRMSYSQGGKIDYTGPAAVHGSKSKPEYVFNYPQFQDLAKKIAQYELVKPPIQPITEGSGFNLRIDNLIKVEGSVDKESLPELKRISNDAITQLTNKLKGWGK